MAKKKIKPTALENPHQVRNHDTNHFIQQVLNQNEAPPRPKDNTVPFAPRSRPPMALLSIFDDDQRTCRVHRIYSDETIIGRESGEVLIPHDLGISGEHLSIERRQETGRYLWVLRDRGSRNGSFLKCQVGRLKDGQEFLIGSYRYQLQIPEPAPPAAGKEGTVEWEKLRPQTEPPSLIQLGSPDADPFLLAESSYWVGRDDKQAEIVLDDPLVSPRHARLCFTDKDGWHLQDNKSLNGIWLRFQQVRVTDQADFQLGEQRFSLRVY